jgi:hypothetical protein
MKKKYKVTLYYHTNAEVIVEAEDEKGAIQEAREIDTYDQITAGLQEDSSPDVEYVEDE